MTSVCAAICNVLLFAGSRTLAAPFASAQITSEIFKEDAGGRGSCQANGSEHSKTEENAASHGTPR